MYVLQWRTVSALTRMLFWCLFPGLQSNSGNKHQNNTRVHKQFATRVHTLSYFLHDIRNYKWRINLWSPHIDPVSHSPGLHSADDVAIDCWWSHNGQTIVTIVTYLVRYRFYSRLYSWVVVQDIFCFVHLVVLIPAAAEKMLMVAS